MSKFNSRDPEALELALLELFPEDWLRQKAVELGVVERHRKLDPVILFWALVLGFGVGTQRQLASLRRAYETQAGETIAASSFYDRFTPELVAFLKIALQRALDQGAEPSRPLHERLAGFRDVVVTDGSILRVHEDLAGLWAGARTNHSPAAIKLTLITSLLSDAPRSLELRPGKTADAETLEIGDWVKDRLLLFDLGYYSFEKFANINSEGGFYISRCKDGANPEITRAHRVWRGRSVDVEGKKLKDVLGSLKRGVLDVEVEVKLGRGKKAETACMRLVGIKNAETGKYHLYFTNVPPERLSAEDVALMYGARWEIETLFKELKSRYALDALPSSKPHVVEALVYTALLTLVVSRRLLGVIRRRDPANAKRMTNLRWAEVFTSHAHRIMDRVLALMGLKLDFFEYIDLLSDQAIDPNNDRERLSDRWLA